MRIGFNRSVGSQAGYAALARKPHQEVAWPGHEATRVRVHAEVEFELELGPPTRVRRGESRLGGIGACALLGESNRLFELCHGEPCLPHALRPKLLPPHGRLVR